MKRSPAILDVTATTSDNRRRFGRNQSSLKLRNPLQFSGKCLPICLLTMAGLFIGLLPACAGNSKSERLVVSSGTLTGPSSDFLSIQVGADGAFNMGANPTDSVCAFSAPFATPCEYNLMFDWPGEPGTSFTTIRVDGQDFQYAEGEFVSPPADSADGLENTSTADFTGLTERTRPQVVQTLTIVQGVRRRAQPRTTARIR